PPLPSLDSLQDRSILVVDDNTISQTILQKQLESVGAKVRLFPSGTLALEYLKTSPEVDLIITDMNMPEMDGASFYQQVIQAFGEAAYPAILLNSGADQPAVKDYFRTVLSKPVRQERLLTSVAAVITGTALQPDQEQLHVLNAEIAQDYPLSILVAEDNKVNQKLVLRMLAKLGYEADLAQNGREAVEMVAQQQYDLVLMDVQMPEMDGITATRQILATQTDQPVIIAMTANALKSDLEACLAAGMAEHLPKPFRSPQLISILQKYSKTLP
ncbi:MAG: response regulator, partial [Bacteroidota bacterium]